ncbi:chaplin [Streptomyces aurantiacus]|uniref:Chaplin domain-containing protein n=1 Tax=Streptomyces aurantiacus JA 4570 TaxID=1286094 RepID=S3ZH10_9ACTN|nr:chaplin [Streptomyces aurantiacus]EPH42921.1 hypothetical protein STRAU_4005 [Streptomyces aurantiacus JA 4570]
MRKRAYFAAAALATTAVLGVAGTAAADPDPSGAQAQADVSNSAGVLSGNAVQVPIDLGLNVCGNTIDVLGLLNPASDNKCKTN